MQRHLRMMTNCGLQIAIFTAAGGVMRIKDTFSIVKDGRTQEYMQVSMTFQIWF